MQQFILLLILLIVTYLLFINWNYSPMISIAIVILYYIMVVKYNLIELSLLIFILVVFVHSNTLRSIPPQVTFIILSTFIIPYLAIDTTSKWISSPYYVLCLLLLFYSFVYPISQSVSITYDILNSNGKKFDV
jgi:hypothetical protein